MDIVDKLYKCYGIFYKEHNEQRPTKIIINYDEESELKRLPFNIFQSIVEMDVKECRMKTIMGMPHEVKDIPEMVME